MNPIKLLTVVGARPQFIKAATVTRAAAARDEFHEVMVHTGQHFDPNMSDVFFDELAIPEPNYHLGIAADSHGAMTGRMLERIEEVIIRERPDWVLVYGDTNSTLAGALAAAKLHVPVAHVEAGLRSFNRRMPEEINRVLVDHVSALLLCPTVTAMENLAREGVVANAHHVGDVMYDAAIASRLRARERSTILARLGLEPDEFVLATVHRAENTDDPTRLREVLDLLQTTSRARPVVLPLHPRTRNAAARYGIDLDGLIVTEPVGYLDMSRLLDACSEVMTDSGGVQKEAYFYGKPCVTLRDETEWVETIRAGWNRLWTDSEYASPRRSIEDYGRGHAADEVLARISDSSR